MNLTGMDLREPPYRRETFIRFYLFHLRHRTHPGCVYFLLPWLAEQRGWSDEEALWFAFINGNTQHPLTSLAIHQAAPTPDHADAAIAFWRAHYGDLAWDTDRRYHRKSFDVAVQGYRDLIGPHRSQAAFWLTRGSWRACWQAASAIPTFGRLSAWSYLEYVNIFGYGHPPDDLMLMDRPGSRSHRNGLCIVAGLDHLDWHKSNPDFDGRYDPETLGHLDHLGTSLLREARRRGPNDGPTWGHVNYFTLESALCTYKSWHRPNRRYANAYADMLHERIKATPLTIGVDPDEFWQARADSLPPRLLLERTPTDPGLTGLKQNHYRLTGRPVMLGTEDPEMMSDFDNAVAAGSLGLFR